MSCNVILGLYPRSNKYFTLNIITFTVKRWFYVLLSVPNTIHKTKGKSPRGTKTLLNKPQLHYSHNQ